MRGPRSRKPKTTFHPHPPKKEESQSEACKQKRPTAAPPPSAKGGPGICTRTAPGAIPLVEKRKEQRLPREEKTFVTGEDLLGNTGPPKNAERTAHWYVEKRQEQAELKQEKAHRGSSEKNGTLMIVSGKRNKEEQDTLNTPATKKESTIA